MTCFKLGRLPAEAWVSRPELRVATWRGGMALPGDLPRSERMWGRVGRLASGRPLALSLAFVWTPRSDSGFWSYIENVRIMPLFNRHRDFFEGTRRCWFFQGRRGTATSTRKGSTQTGAYGEI